MPCLTGMPEFFSALFLAFSLAACVSKGSAVDAVNYGMAVNGVLNTAAYGGGVYIGVSGRMSLREKEGDYAKLHIAHQIAMNRKCVVDYGYVSIEGSPGNSRSVYDSNFDYDDTAVDEILARLVMVDERRFPGFTVIAARDPGAAPGGPAYRIERSAGERPSWIRRVPEIDGCYTASGIGERYSEPYKSILVADIEAAQNLAKEKNALIRGFTYNAEHSGPGGGSKLVSGDLVLTRAELYGFYILDRWIEDDGTCYSLAAARKQ